MLPVFDRLYTRIFFRDRWYFGGLLSSVLLNIAIWALIIWRFDVLYRVGGSQLALHYKVVYGIDFLANWYYAVLLPLGGLAFIVLNYFFARMAYHYQRLAVYSLVLTAVFAQCILLWAMHLIIRVNIF